MDQRTLQFSGCKHSTGSHTFFCLSSVFSLHHQSNLKTQDWNKTLNLLDYTFEVQMTQSMSVL